MNIKGVNLIVDTNYILYRTVYALTKTNTLYGDLEKCLEVSFEVFLHKYPFKNIYLVSDSKKSSWRKQLMPQYKAGRKDKRDKEEIDWEFCFNTYDHFKSNLTNKRISVLEADGVEGDDWIRYLIEKSNNESLSCVYVASDKDLNQFLEFNLAKGYINIQWYDNYTNTKVYMPKNYVLFIEGLKEIQTDIFNMSENYEFNNLITDLTKRAMIEEVDKEISLFVKIISGDKSDNIRSVIEVPLKTNPLKTQGIGDAGALKIYHSFKQDYPEDINFADNQWLSDLLPYILTYKKIDSKKYNDEVEQKLKLNRSMIHLHENYIPKNISSKIIL